MAEETTFGCGEFLPGRGPFNFPDGPTDPGVNDPRGPNIEADPGPDPGVYEPPDVFECACRPASVQIPIIIYLGSDGSYQYWEQQILKNCVPIVNGFPIDNTIDVITAAQTGLAQAGYEVTQTNPGDRECQSQTEPPGQDPDCESQYCDPIKLFYRRKLYRNLDPSSTEPSRPPGDTYSVPDCKCVVFTPGPSVEIVSQTSLRTRYRYTWQRRCTDVKNGFTPAQEVISNFINTLTFDNFTVGSSVPPQDVPCTTTSNGGTGVECNSTFQCPDISLVIDVRNDPTNTGPPGPAPPGPTTPGPAKRACRCVVNSNTPIENFSFDAENNITYVSATWTQNCENVIGWDGLKNKKVYSSWRQDQLGSGGRNYQGGPTNNFGPACASPTNRCNGSCPDIVVTYEIPGDRPGTPIGEQNPVSPAPLPEIPGDVEEQTPVPKPNGPGNIGDVPLGPSGVVVDGGGPNSGTPLGPQAPGPGPSLPGTVGGEGGNGGTNLGEFDEASLPTTLESQGVTNRVSGKTEIEKINNSGLIDLSDPAIAAAILKAKPSGQEDEEVFFKYTSKRRKKVKNTSNKTDIFDKVIDESFLKLMEADNTFGDWDSSLAASVTPEIIYDNLNSKARSFFDSILDSDGSHLSRLDIYAMVAPRLLNGSISELKMGDLINILDACRGKNEIKIIRSSSEIVNETVALGLIENSYFPLNYTEYDGLGRETFKNQKILSSDIDRYIDVTIAGVTQRYYVNDDDTFIGRSTLKLKDGEYFDVTLAGNTTRVYAESEKDHAYFVPEETRQVAIKLLGGDPSRTLSVSGDPSAVELDHSLNTPRESVYFLSCVLSSVTTSLPLNESRHLKQTKVRYDYVSLRNINEINEYIKYKNNNQTFILHDEDLLLDYVETNGEIFLEQTDIIVDSPKENKTLPLLTRQIPWYILLYPTNRPEYLPFDVKSQIVDIIPATDTSPGRVTRELITKPTITPNFRNKTNQFVQTSLVGKGAKDVFAEPTNDARINKINVDNPLFSTGYIDSAGEIVSSSKFSPSRGKTGYRLLKEIIQSLDQNYLLGLNGVGKTLTEFDVLSRFNLKQYNTLSKLEGFSNIKKAVFNGMFNEVRVVPATKNSDSKVAFNKTQLVRRKSTAPATDPFPEQKATNSGSLIKPPTVDDPPTSIPFVPPAPPTAIP